MIKKEIKKGINLYMIKDSKFKSFRSCVLIYRDLTREEVTKNTLLTAVMRMGCEKYPDSKSISEAFENLYGADLIARASKYSEQQIIKIGVKTVCDTVINNSNFSDAMNLLKEVAFFSGVNKSFKEDVVETEKKNIRDAILSQKNDKRSYSVLRLQEEMCKNEPYGINPLGYIDKLEKIDKDELYSHYQKILKESRIDFIITGNFDEEKATECVEKMTHNLPERDGAVSKAVYVKGAGKVNTVTDKMDVTQGKLCMGWRAQKEISRENYPSAVVYNSIFGGSATSKLFENVREKLSLCYYVSSSLDRLKNIMIVRSGVEFENFSKAYDEIMAQQQKMISGDITSDEIEAAKKQITSAYQANYDSVASMEEYYTMQLLLGTDISIEEMKDMVKKVSLEDIKDIAKSMVLDTVYYIDGE